MWARISSRDNFTLDKRNKGITLLVVTNGAGNNSFKKLDQLSSLGLEFSDNEIISSRIS